MSYIDEYEERLEKNVRRLELCTMVVLEVKENLTDPLLPDRRADLLIAIENLAQETYYLVQEIRDMCWEEDRQER